MRYLDRVSDRSVHSRTRSIVFTSAIFVLLSTTITFVVLYANKSCPSPSRRRGAANGAIGFPPIVPDDGDYVQWTLLHLNDVYEMMPSDDGRKGGLARVAHARQLLLDENKETYTILSGDFLSPSAMSQSNVNGSQLNGRQMISAFNQLGLDLVTFGNHEFDLTSDELLLRMNESNFVWIGSNVNVKGTDQPLASAVRYHLLTIDRVRVLLIGLTIDVNSTYVQIVNGTSLIPFVQQFLRSISHLQYDVLVALTHLDMPTDIQLVENIAQIDLLLGGHQHENYFLSRSSPSDPTSPLTLKSTSIFKADANARSVYIHRCLFNVQTKQLRVYSTLTPITSQLDEDANMAQLINSWYTSAMHAFQLVGFQINQTVSCLPAGVELDGRATSVRNFGTSLSVDACASLLRSTSDNATIVGVYHSGSLRIDDILRGKINQYDILRVFPYDDHLVSLSVPGLYLSNVLSEGVSMRGTGAFLSFCGVHSPDGGKTWLVNGTDISTTGLSYHVATITYLEKTKFTHSTIDRLHEFLLTQAHSLIHYFQKKYPAC